MWGSEPGTGGLLAPIALADPSPTAPGAACPAPRAAASHGSHRRGWGAARYSFSPPPPQNRHVGVGVGWWASAVLPSSPVLAGHSSNSRIVWEHTRGRYTCMQCPYSTASREEMTLHIEDHRKNPPPPGRLDADMGTDPRGRGKVGRRDPQLPWGTYGEQARPWPTRTPLALLWVGGDRLLGWALRSSSAWRDVLEDGGAGRGGGSTSPSHRSQGARGLATALTALFLLPPDFGVGIAPFHAKLTPEMENSLYSQL